MSGMIIYRIRLHLVELQLSFSKPHIPHIFMDGVIFVFLVQTEELIKALQDLENAASGDATVRQKIASLPQEVQDVSLWKK